MKRYKLKWSWMVITMDDLVEIKEPKKSVVPDSRENLGKIDWFFIDDDCDILHTYRSIDKKNVRPTQELAEASLAKSQLAMLKQKTRDNYWWREPDWEDIGQNKYIIYFTKWQPVVDRTCYINEFLAFPTIEIRDEFLKKHKDLIEQAKELL